MEKVISLLNEKLKHNNLLREKDFYKIIEDLCYYYKLDGILQNVVYDNDDINHHCSAVYNNCGRIVFFPRDMQKNCCNNYHYYLLKYPYMSYSNFALINQLITILHEIKHAIQHKLSTSDNLDGGLEVIANLIRDCSYIPPSIYQKYYDIIPIERDALIFSYAETINLLNECLVSKEILHSLNLEYSDIVLESYQTKHNIKKGIIHDFYRDAYRNSLMYHLYLFTSRHFNIYQKISFNMPLSNDELELIQHYREQLLLGNDVSHNRNNRILFKTKSTII